MSDRIIRAASVRQVRTWTPAALVSGGSAVSSGPVKAASVAAALAGESTSAPVSSHASQMATLEEQFQQAIEQARADAYAAGFEQGHAQAVSEMKAARADSAGDALAGLVDAFAHTVSVFETETQQVQAGLPVWVTDMALAVARQVLGDADVLDARKIGQRLTQALSSVNESLRSRVELIVHPDTRAALESLRLPALKALADRITDDEGLAPGGFRLRTSAGVIDHSIETRWRQTVETFCADTSRQKWI